MINKDYLVSRIKDPYDIWIIDNFFNEETLNKIQEQWLDNDSEKWHSERCMVAGQDNILEHRMLAISKIQDAPHFIAIVWQYLHSNAFVDLVSDITKITELKRDSTMRWSGMRVMLPESYQLIHSDARKHPETGLRKEITCLLYFNENYNRETHEGCLEIWNDNMTKCIHEIEPINNRLVMFKNSDTSYHGVPVVKKDRKAIICSIMKKANCSERGFAEFVCRPKDPEQVHSMGKNRGEGK